jgi:hypothetical protein
LEIGELEIGFCHELHEFYELGGWMVGWLDGLLVGWIGGWGSLDGWE